MQSRTWTVLAGVVCLAVVSGCSTHSTHFTEIKEGINAIESRNAENRLEVINGVYEIGPPDVLEVKVRDNEDLSTPVTVRPDGNITFPLLGDVYVEGKTPQEISDTLEKELDEYIKDAQVTATVVGFNSKKIYVFGEVARPGPQAFTGDVTVVDAIANAGSITIRSAPARARVVRGNLEDPIIFKVDLKDLTQQGNANLNLQLRHGDIVFVPTNFFAKIGYAVDNMLYPFRSLLGVAYTATAVQNLD